MSGERDSVGSSGEDRSRLAEELRRFLSKSPELEPLWESPESRKILLEIVRRHQLKQLEEMVSVLRQQKLCLPIEKVEALLLDERLFRSESPRSCASSSPVRSKP